MMDLMGKYAEEQMKHAVFTFEENIKFMEQAVYMAKHKEETCNEWNLKEEDFVCWMFGWMMGTLDSCSKDLKLIAALKYQLNKYHIYLSIGGSKHGRY